MDFHGKVVVITGSARGLGKYVAITFLQKGAKVCISDVDVENGNATLKLLMEKFGEENVIFCKCDVSKEEDFQAVFEECEKKLGIVDILINNAGIYEETDWQKSITINYGGVVRGSEMALKKIGKHNGGKGGHVVNISSIAAVSKMYFCPFYSASKAAITQYTRCVGHEFHYDYTGVSFQALCPDGMETRFFKRAWDSYYSPQILQKQKTIKSLPKLTTAEVTDALFQLIEDKKPGAIMAVEKNVKPYYCEPIIPKEY